MKFVRVTMFLVLSPSRALFDFLKGKAANRTEFHRSWSCRLLIAELTTACGLVVSTSYFPQLKSSLSLALILLAVAWSRINELAFAFIKMRLANSVEESHHLTWSHLSGR